MFVLCEAVHYEGESVIGLYSSLELAIEAAASYDRRGLSDDRSGGYCSTHWDDLLVYEVPVDAPSYWRGVDSLWSLVMSRKAAA
jgi:hypothetical protein